MSLKTIDIDGMTERLYPVEGELAANYNRSLEKVIGKRTELTSFHLDKRGESPEIEAELGRNYLQAGPAHRFCIVVSPDQQNASLIHEEFSFDREILDFLYKNHGPAISVATRVDSLCGEIDDGVRIYDSADDLLLLKKVHLELHTPSGFLSNARELQRMKAMLEKNPELLIEDDSAHLHRLLELVKSVGDVRNYNLNPISATKELTAFYTRLFDGAFVFGDVQIPASIRIRRPGKGGKGDYDDDYEADFDEIRERLSGEESGGRRARSVTAVIHGSSGQNPEGGPFVSFIPMEEKNRIVDFLVENRYVRYTSELIEERLCRIEDEVLIREGLDVTRLSARQRDIALNASASALDPAWHELRDLKKRVIKGYPFPNAFRRASPDVRAMLLKINPDRPQDGTVTRNLLTKLFPLDYEAMSGCNRSDLRKILKDAGEMKRKYIRHLLENLGENQTA